MLAITVIGYRNSERKNVPLTSTKENGRKKEKRRKRMECKTALNETE